MDGAPSDRFARPRAWHERARRVHAGSVSSMSGDRVLGAITAGLGA